MSRPPRILFVTFADSLHAQGWIGLMHGSDFEVRVFSVPVQSTSSLPPAWTYPTYVVNRPNGESRGVGDIRSLIPEIPYTRSLSNWVEDRFALSARWLARIIRSWRPDIIHSLPLHTGGKLTRKALERIPISQWPRWIASSWGSDVYVGLDDPVARPNIEFILRHCDGFMADCRRDLRLASEAGLRPEKIAFLESVPGNGGIDVDRFATLRSWSAARNLILVPKAFEREHANRTFTVLEALRLAGDVLDGYEVHLLMASKSVRNWLRKMPESLQRRCHCREKVPQPELFEMLSRTRLMVAPSLSDGTPNVMLEAMAAGALPVVSPLESILEWVEDGRNGLLAHALYPEQIAAAVRRGIKDDPLFESAKVLNWEIIRMRANRNTVRGQVLEYYHSMADKTTPADKG